MGTIATRGGGDFVLAPEGTHSAVCVSVIDMGTAPANKWGKRLHKILLSWALDIEDAEDEVVVHQQYTLSLYEKANLRHHLDSWRGKAMTEAELEGFEVKTLLGAPCLIGIIHNSKDGKTYANVSSVTRLPKGMKPMKAAKTTYFSLDEPDMAVFEGFAQNLQEKIKASEEWEAREAAPQPEGGDPGPADPPSDWDADDDIPF